MKPLEIYKRVLPLELESLINGVDMLLSNKHSEQSEAPPCMYDDGILHYNRVKKKKKSMD